MDLIHLPRGTRNVRNSIFDSLGFGNLNLLRGPDDEEQPKKDESLQRISETFNLALKAHVMFKDEIKNVESKNKQTMESRRMSKDISSQLQSGLRTKSSARSSEMISKLS